MEYLSFADAVVWIASGGSAAIAALVAWLWRRRRGQIRSTGPTRASWTSGLAKTRGSLARRLLDAWRGPSTTADWLVQVEEILLGSDVGVQATQALVDGLRGRMGTVDSEAGLREILKAEITALLSVGGQTDAGDEVRPRVILVVGVNGVGKTTTIGKLANRYKQQGKSVLLIAGDTFRAAACEQLALWAERVGVDLVKHQQGADPSAVMFDGVQAAVSRGIDVAIADTAGRLHVKANLMEELKKIARTVGRQVKGAPHEVLLVIDATTGQNALNQARVFHETIPVTGVVLTKLDGTARGGVALAISRELGLPIRYVGLGERAEDLAEFDPAAFAGALFEEGETSP